MSRFEYFNAALLFVQAALRRKQAQEMEYAVSLAGVQVKNETRSECGLSVPRTPKGPSGGPPSSHGGTGEMSDPIPL